MHINSPSYEVEKDISLTKRPLRLLVLHFLATEFVLLQNVVRVEGDEMRQLIHHSRERHVGEFLVGVAATAVLVHAGEPDLF